MGRLIDAHKVFDNIALIASVKAKSDAQKSLVGRILYMIDSMPTIDEKQAWIPCSEKPEIGRRVLVALNSNGYKSIHIGEMYEESWLLDGEFWYDKDDPIITHWMPLPEHPEGGEDDDKR